MKKIFMSTLPVAAIVMLAVSPLINPLPIGSSIPKTDVKMKDIHGKEVSFKDAMNKNGLLVMFSCNTCPVVRGYQPRTNEVCKYAMDKQIGVILINSNEAYRDNGDSYSDMQEYGKNNNYSWYYVVDNNSEMADAFGANRTPECFLFNKEGKLVYHGAIDNNPNSPEEVAVKETRSVGCSIKRKG